jgi:hypothetical protein
MLSEDFVFSSPRDDHISREVYFDRCWPSPPPFRDIAVEYVAIEGDEAAVCYRAEKPDGSAFRTWKCCDSDVTRSPPSMSISTGLP